MLFLSIIITSCQKSVSDLEDLIGNNDPKESVSSNLIYEETFEGPAPFSTAYDSKDHIGSWDYAMKIVSNPVYKGARAVRFEIRKDQPLVKNGKRAEVVIVKDSISKNSWYSFSAYFPTEGYEYDSEREIICQWYQKGTPATSLRTKRDRFLLESGSIPGSLVKYDLGLITKDAWHEFVLHFIHSYTSDGFVEVWHNGLKVLTVNGANMYDNTLPKWKIGLYKASFKFGTSLVDKRIIYFDNIRVGNANASFENLSSL